MDVKYSGVYLGWFLIAVTEAKAGIFVKAILGKTSLSLEVHQV